MTLTRDRDQGAALIDRVLASHKRLLKGSYEMNQPQPRVLSVPERGQILRQVVKTKVTDHRDRIIWIDGYGNISTRTHGPLVRQWGDTWADVAMNNWPTHPAVIVKDFIFTSLTCGLYYWWWLFTTFRTPPLFTISIDEYGYEHWTQNEISAGQKSLRWILLGALALVILLFVGGLFKADEVPVVPVTPGY